MSLANILVHRCISVAAITIRGLWLSGYGGALMAPDHCTGVIRAEPLSADRYSARSSRQSGDADTPLLLRQAVII